MGTPYSELAAETFRHWFGNHREDIDALVFDVDGVLMIKGHPMPGAAEVLATVRRQGLPFTLLTNDGCSSPEQKCAKLRESGLDLDPSELVSCGHGLEELTVRRGWQGAPVFVMGSLGDPCYAERAGLEVVRDIARMEQCRCAIIGENTFDWQKTLDAAFNVLIRRPDYPLVVPNPDEYFPGRSGRLHVGSGALARFLQTLCRTYGVTISPQYLGKPYEPIFQVAHHRIERRAGTSIVPERVLVIGDSIASDIMGGCRFGYRTALVLTGITRPDMDADAEYCPDLVFQTL